MLTSKDYIEAHMKKEIKQATNAQALSVIVIIFTTLLFGFVAMNIDGIIMLASAAFIAGVFAIYLGYSWSDMTSAISNKISESIPALLILLSIGVLISTWMMGGVIPAMIYYGLEVINPNYLLLTAFIVSSAISIATGTSWGTVGTIGVALIGVGTGMGVPLPMVAGAVISGAYFGDKMSPLSDTTNMAALAAKADLYDHIRQMMVTTIPAMVIACIAFTFMGFNFQSSNIESPIYMSMLSDLTNNFIFSPILIVPPAIVLYGAITKKATVPVLIISSLTAAFIGITLQGIDAGVVISSIKSGFNASTAMPDVKLSPEVIKLLNRGGAASMFEAVIFILIAFTFGGIIQLTNSLEIALKSIMSSLQTVTQVVLAAGFSATVIIAIAQNSYISYFLVSQTYSEKFKELKLKEQNLSRILEDFVTVLEGLMPWTVSGVYMATTLGVAALDFAPYAVFNVSCVLLSILYALTYKSLGKYAFSFYTDEEVANKKKNQSDNTINNLKAQNGN